MVIAIDCDGILSNFYLSACKRFNQPYKSVTQFYQEWLPFSEISGDHDFWENLEVLNPPEALSFEFDYYMTSLPKKMLESRRKWLLKNGFPDKPIIISHKKHKDCIKYGIDLLIDDKPETIKACREAGVKCIQYIPYYSEMPLMTPFHTKHLYEIKQMLKEI